MSDCAVRLYAVLLRYGQSSGARMPGRATLARRLRKRSTDSVDRAMKELVALGAVIVEHRQDGRVRLTGLTPRARTAMDAVIQRFGVHDVGGFCPGGCRSGHVQGSDHYTGHAVDFMLLPMNERNELLGDQIASWLVANGNTYGVKYVIWNERIWSAQRASEGWRPYEHPSGSDNATLAHEDHVHLSVY